MSVRVPSPPLIDDPGTAPGGVSRDARRETDSGRPQGEAARTAALLVAALAATVPMAWVTVAWANAGAVDDWTRRISIAPFDLVLVVTLLWSLPHRRDLRELIGSRWAAATIAIYGAAFGLALVVHPSWLGFALTLRLAAAGSVVIAVAIATTTPRTARLALGSISVVGAFQAGLALVQAARGRAFSVPFLDFGGPLYPFGTSHAGRGGLDHPYHLAVILVVAQGATLLGLRRSANRWPWLGSLVVISGGLAVTYSRAGLLGQAVLVLVLLLARVDRRVLAMAAGAVLLGLAVGGVAFGNGWVAKGEISGGSNPTSSRGERIREGLGMFEENPISGIGPGRYVSALHGEHHSEYLPAHNVVVHEAAELGVLGGVATVGLLLVLLVASLKGGTWSSAVTLPMLPFLLLDAYPYVFATGLAASGLWIGLILVSHRTATA